MRVWFCGSVRSRVRPSSVYLELSEATLACRVCSWSLQSPPNSASHRCVGVWRSFLHPCATAEGSGWGAPITLGWLFLLHVLKQGTEQRCLFAAYFPYPIAPVLVDSRSTGGRFPYPTCGPRFGPCFGANFGTRIRGRELAFRCHGENIFALLCQAGPAERLPKTNIAVVGNRLSRSPADGTRRWQPGLRWLH